jgi:hypothetical protein
MCCARLRATEGAGVVGSMKFGVPLPHPHPSPLTLSSPLLPPCLPADYVGQDYEVFSQWLGSTQ